MILRQIDEYKPLIEFVLIVLAIGYSVMRQRRIIEGSRVVFSGGRR